MKSEMGKKLAIGGALVAPLAVSASASAETCAFVGTNKIITCMDVTTTGGGNQVSRVDVKAFLSDNNRKEFLGKTVTAKFRMLQPDGSFQQNFTTRYPVVGYAETAKPAVSCPRGLLTGSLPNNSIVTPCHTWPAGIKINVPYYPFTVYAGKYKLQMEALAAGVGTDTKTIDIYQK